MADPSKLEKVKIQSTSRTSSTTHSPKWPQPGGGGSGERAWTKEPVYCRSHGPPPFVEPRAIRDLSPKRKEWEAQFPQPVLDLHCEFHGNSIQDYFQRELRRISRTRLSMNKDTPSNTLAEFLQEKQKKIERSISNQKDRDRKSLRIIQKLEKENLEKHDAQSNKEFAQNKFVQRPRKVLKGTKATVLPELKKGLQDEEISSRLQKTNARHVSKEENSTTKDVHVEFKDDYGTRNLDQRGTKKDPWSHELQKTAAKSLSSKPQQRMYKPTANNIESHEDLCQQAKLEENAATSLVPDDGRVKISEELEARVDSFPVIPISNMGPVIPSFKNPYQWISLPQNLTPAPPHIEDPYSNSSNPPQLGRNPTSTVTVPLTLLSSPLLLGYHDTYKMDALPILVGH